VADVRFLPNPYWIDELRHLTGRDEPVRNYVMGMDAAQRFARAYVSALRIALDSYVNEHKRYATVAIGCTGGRHRSVALAEEVATELRMDGRSVRTMHRDIGKE
jgi:UPF0042 nucleotide-binding protein